MSDITPAELRRRTDAMKALSDDDRRAAIDAASNVIGFARFNQVARQRDLCIGYRGPRRGDVS